MIKFEKINKTAPHWHDDQIEIIMIISGCVEAQIGCDGYSMHQGNILIIGTEDVHSYRGLDDGNAAMILSITCGEFADLFPGIENWNLICDPDVEKNDEESLSKIRSLLLKAAVSHLKEQEYRDIIEDILLFCRDNFLSTNLVKRKSDAKRTEMEIFQRISEYIEENYQNPLSLSEISASIRYSFNYTSFLVRKITGMSFISYLNHIRCFAAERMLISTGRKITDIALDCGFSDSRAFNRYFSKIYRTSPSSYRKRLLKSFSPAERKDNPDLSADPMIESRLLNLEDRNCGRIRLFPKQGSGKAFSLPPLPDTDDSGQQSDGPEAVRLFLNSLSGEPRRRFSMRDGESGSVFCGGSGLLTAGGIRKSLYHVWMFTSEIESVVLNRRGLIVGLGRDDLRIIIYRADSSDSSVVKLAFEPAMTPILAERRLIDGKHGNPFGLWKGIGSPQVLSQEVHELISASAVPAVGLEVFNDCSSRIITELPPAEGAVLYRFTNKISPEIRTTPGETAAGRRLIKRLEISLSDVR